MSGSSIYDSSLTTLALTITQLGEDDKINAESIYDSTKDISALWWNNVVYGLAEVARRTFNGNIAHVHFTDANVVAAQTDKDVPRSSDANDLYAVAPFDGSIVGISARLENAITAGGTSALVLSWTKNGTEQTLTCTLDDTTNTQQNYAVQVPMTETISAGDYLGISYTSDAAMAAGVTPSMSVDLLVSYGDI